MKNKKPLILSLAFVSLLCLNFKDMHEDKEIFLPIKGYEGFYEVSNHGRIKSLERVDCMGQHRKERILRQPKDTDGYPLIVLSKDRTSKTRKPHRLVASAFILNPDNLPQVNHKDGNKSNNHVSNLEWCSTRHNAKHARRLGLHPEVGETHKFAKLKANEALEIFNAKLPYRELSIKYNIGISAISHIKAGHTWSEITGRHNRKSDKV